MGKSGLRPAYRFKLRAKMFELGFKSEKDFATAAGVKTSTINNVVNAWRFPGPELQSKIASGLNVSLPELKKLLQA